MRITIMAEDKDPATNKRRRAERCINIEQIEELHSKNILSDVLWDIINTLRDHIEREKRK